MPDEKLRQPASPTTLLYGAVTGDQPASTDRQPPRPTLAIALVAVVLLVTGHRLARNSQGGPDALPASCARHCHGAGEHRGARNRCERDCAGCKREDRVPDVLRR